MISNKVSDVIAYQDIWDPKFSISEIELTYQKLIDYFQNADFTQFTSDDLKTLDWRWFDENLICMPSWVIDCLPNGTVLTSIDGDEMIFTKPQDKNSLKDTQFGVVAYGFTKSQIRNGILEIILGD